MRRVEPRIFHSWGSRGRPRRSLKNHPRQSPTICLSYTSFPVFSNPTATVEVVGNTGKLSLKRLASAVQLRPWPPSFQRTCPDLVAWSQSALSPFSQNALKAAFVGLMVNKLGPHDCSSVRTAFRAENHDARGVDDTGE